MNQALDSRLQLDKSSKVGHSTYSSSHSLPNSVLVTNRIPGLRQQLLHSDGNTPLLGIDLQDLDLDLLLQREHIRGLVDAAPGDVSYMEQGVRATNIDERTVVGQAAHGSIDDVAFLQLGIAMVLCRLLLFFSDDSAIDHHVFFGGIKFGDTTPDFLLDQLGHLRRITSAAT